MNDLPAVILRRIGERRPRLQLPCLRLPCQHALGLGHGAGLSADKKCGKSDLVMAICTRKVEKLRFVVGKRGRANECLRVLVKAYGNLYVVLNRAC